MSDRSTFERARRPEQKEQRRTAILAASSSLATTGGVRNVTLGDIATSAGMSKSNVLRYFGTREEIYLELLIDALNAWVEELSHALATSGASGPHGAARVVADTLGDRPLLCDLLSQGAATLEHNVRPERGRDFKVAWMAATAHLGQTLAAAIPGLVGTRPLEAGVTTALSVASIWPTCNTPQAVLDLMDPAALALFPLTFSDRLSRVLHVYYVGLLAI